MQAFHALSWDSACRSSGPSSPGRLCGGPTSCQRLLPGASAWRAGPGASAWPPPSSSRCLWPSSFWRWCGSWGWGRGRSPGSRGSPGCREESFSPQATACISSWTPPGWTWTAGSPPCWAAASSCGQSLKASRWGVWNLCATCLRWRQRGRWPAQGASVGGKKCYKSLKVKTISRI